MRILVTEDEPRVAAAIARGLEREGAAVDVAGDGERALFLARVHPYDVVVLDRDVPGVHGDDVCRALNAERPATKVLMLTAAASIEDVVDGLRLGADDYMVKPPGIAGSEGGPVHGREAGGAQVEPSSARWGSSV
jgi:two-component system, OmpR family, response regulator VanR